MNTTSDVIDLNRERASRHIDKRDRAWRIGGIAVATFFLLWMLLAYAL